MWKPIQHHVFADARQPFRRCSDKAADGQNDAGGITPSRYFSWLLLLFALFCLRVAGQLLQLLWPQDFLPSFEAWDSGALPYWALLSAQLVIVAVMIRVLAKVRRNAFRPSRRASLILLVLGSAYLAVMVFRLIAGQTFLAHNIWFASTLPTLFHFVLAAFLLLVGCIHHVRNQHEFRRRTRRLFDLR